MDHYKESLLFFFLMCKSDLQHTQHTSSFIKQPKPRDTITATDGDHKNKNVIQTKSKSAQNDWKLTESTYSAQWTNGKLPSSHMTPWLAEDVAWSGWALDWQWYYFHCWALGWVFLAEARAGVPRAFFLMVRQIKVGGIGFVKAGTAQTLDNTPGGANGIWVTHGFNRWLGEAWAPWSSLVKKLIGKEAVWCEVRYCLTAALCWAVMGFGMVRQQAWQGKLLWS